MPKLGLGLGLGPRNNKQYLSFDEKNRIIYDGGIARDQKALEDTLKFFNTLMPNTKLLYCPELGVKLRTSGVNNYVTTLYDISSNMSDGTQTTALNQPYLSGNIAPNEKYSIKNPNNENVYLTHTPISFSATDKWSVTTIVNCNTRHDFINAYLSSGSINLKNVFKVFPYIFYNSEGLGTTGIYRNDKFGKNTVITWVYDGKGFINFYLDGTKINTFEIQGSVNFSEIFGPPSHNRGAYATIKYHCIRDIALTTTQVQDEYNYLRTIFPEIESVQIGTQTWATSNCEMTCTPQGNIIPEMQAATNVEKITNAADREFSSDTGFWTKTSGVTISDGVAHFTNVVPYNGGLRKALLEAGKRYLFTYTVKNWVSGSVALFDGNSGITIATTGNGTYSRYILASGTAAFITSTDLVNKFDIDNVSIQEVGWSDSTNLYNYIYANTSGTAEQKEYAAVKAAAMWCYYNNNPVIGAIYGKLYNWYAVRLLDMDINYYNVANPTTTWGWKVPIYAEHTQLFTYLGGNTVAGGKMKKEGLGYWNTPNTGADNSSGFTALGAGVRISGGTFVNFGAWFAFGSSNFDSSSVIRNSTSDITPMSSYQPNMKTIGTSLRLIKA